MTSPCSRNIFPMRSKQTWDPLVIRTFSQEVSKPSSLLHLSAIRFLRGM